ncbi:peptidoglycan-binding protein [Thalassobacillus hwangdonensis]|uniref:Peptidoglycan-binding protein n=1 Tax=Thalassobacillus hwangdonensis TaxID=546108 RepID=A0ABW3L2Y9_9BACI
MRVRKSYLLSIILILSVFHFSPQITEAATGQTNGEEGAQEEVSSSEETIQTEESEAATSESDSTGEVPTDETEADGEASQPTDSEQTTDEPSQETEEQQEPDTSQETDEDNDIENNEASTDEQTEATDEEKQTETVEEEQPDSSAADMESEEVQEKQAPKEDITLEKEAKEKSSEESTMTTFSVHNSNSFQEGDRHEDISRMKEKLNAIGFDGILVTDYYGGFTKQRVEDFQANYALPVTGIADQATLSKLDEVYTSPFQVGGSHQNISDMKVKLNAMGFGGILVTDNYGNYTAKRVADFQQFYGMLPNGIADDLTRTRIKQLYEVGYQPGHRASEISNMKEKLNAIGFGGILVTDYYGSYTSQRVKDFQAYYGLNATGKANAVTLAKIDEVYQSPMQEGKRHDGTIELKENLNRLGFGDILVTTYYGSFTESRVKKFQSYYGLNPNGIADEVTLAKIDEILSSPHMEGKRSEANISLKKNLNDLGYGQILVTDLYGSYTAKKVRDFQEDYGLVVNGIADEVTLAKIDAVFNIGFRQGDSHPAMIGLKQDLNRLGFGDILVTEFYGSFSEKKVKEFQRYYGLEADGVVDRTTFEKIDQILSTPFQEGGSHPDLITMKQKLNWLDYGHILVTDYFGGFTETKIKDFQEDHGLPVSGIAESKTRAEIDQVFASTFQEGSSHEKVKEMKRLLNKTGFGGILITDYYGSFTAQRVREFQSYYGLDATGKADLNTLNKMEEIASIPFQEGERHEDTVVLHQNLNELGFGPLPESTLYDSLTADKVSEFQAYYGLHVSGIADDYTWNKMTEVLSSPFQEGQRHEDTVVMKEKLNALDFGPIIVSTFYGAYTAQQVEKFQEYYGLKVNGITDQPTWEKLNEIHASPYQEGNTSSGTVELKRNLNRLGFGDILVTELYGSFTAQKVTEFQEYYGLRAHGIADAPTFEKIEELLASPLQKGNSHEDVITLKEALIKLGYNGIMVTDYFGDWTEQRLKEFQADYGLPVSGIGDEKTMIELQKAAAASREVYTYSESSYTFKEALDIQMNNFPQTDKYRNDPAYVHGSYLEITQSGAIAGTGVNVRTAPVFGDNIFATLSFGTAITILAEVEGDEYKESTKWYKFKYNDRILYAHSSLVDPDVMTATTTGNLNVRSGPGSDYHKYGLLPKGSKVSIFSKTGNWYEISYSTWRLPTRDDVIPYLNPNNNDQFQHLDLSASVDVNALELSAVLNGKGVLDGMAQSFIDGGQTHGVNELYLISHALLETAHGTSALASGIEVGLNDSGNPVLVTENNRDKLTAIETVFNMFGIGAIDRDAHRAGAVRAYNEEWFSPEAAIIGGAQFIGNRYVHSDYGQNTLYKMRWNPMNPSVHQYATDIGWAVKQVANMRSMYELLNNPLLKFNIVKYK